VDRAVADERGLHLWECFRFVNYRLGALFLSRGHLVGVLVVGVLVTVDFVAALRPRGEVDRGDDLVVAFFFSEQLYRVI
jgi:hypothetical protein